MKPPVRDGASPAVPDGRNAVARARAFDPRLADRRRSRRPRIAPSPTIVDRAPIGPGRDADPRASRPSSPNDSTPSSASPDASPPRTTAPTLFRMVVDETKRALAGRRHRRSGSCTTTASRSRRGPASPTTCGRDCRSSGATRAGSARSCAPATSWPTPTSAPISSTATAPYDARLRGRRPSGRAAHPPRPGPRRAVRRHARAAGLDERRRGVHHDPGHPRSHRPRQRRAVRADRGTRRPARGPPGGVRPDEPRRHGRARSAGPSSRRRAGSSTTTTPGSTWSSCPTRSSRSPSRAASAHTSRSTWSS